MISRWRALVLLWLAAATLAVTEDTPPGLIAKDTDEDLLAEATHSANQAQKRDAGLSNSYGEPLPSNAYGPPPDLVNTVPDPQLPAPIYGVPELQEPPPGAYGPPAPVLVFPDQGYHGPPPPVSKPKNVYGPPKFYGPPKPTYGPPKPTYGPPKSIYGPPKPIYGPPKKIYGPPKQSLPKITFNVPFKPPKVIKPTPIYGVPKPVYGPPKVTYGTPLGPPVNFAIKSPPLAFPELSDLQLPPINIDANLNLPVPIYGTPLVSLPQDLKPNFPISPDSYGPPGESLSVDHNDNLIFETIANLDHTGHYGPPQPDPNPKPPHPGIPAPPTPPHVLYDGWKPIPGISKPIQELHISFEQALPNVNQHKFNSAQITSGYSNIHHDALANIDLNAIVGGDSNHIDQSKTVFEAHYTENELQNIGQDVKHLDTYSTQHLDSSNGIYTGSIRQHGAKGLIPPSGIYGVPLGSQYGAPPKFGPHLPIPYGQYSGGGHTGGHTPEKPIKFREPVPDGLIESIGHTTHTKDSLHYDNLEPGLTYLPPPVKNNKNTNAVNLKLNSVSLSIEPTNLYSLPHAGNAIGFHKPSNLYGLPVDSYSAPLLTVGVGDPITSGSHRNAITSTIDGTILANLSNLDAAAILKHCPYHEAIIKAAKFGNKIPEDLASTYVASLSSLGNTLNKGNKIQDYTKDLIGSQSVVHTVFPDNYLYNEKYESNSSQKSKSNNEKQTNKDEKLNDQILKTSERIRSLSEEARVLQQKIVNSNQNLHIVTPQGKIGYSVQIQPSNNQNGKVNVPGIPHEQLLSEGLLQSILQAIDDPSTTKPSNFAKQYQYQNQNFIATQNYQNLAREVTNRYPQPQQQSQVSNQFSQYQQTLNYPQSEINLSPSNDGLDLPVGYEPIDRTKNSDNSKREDTKHNHSPCDLKTEGSIKTEVVVPAPKINNVKSTDGDPNEVAIFFGDKSDETVTEISVATSISEGSDDSRHGDDAES